MSKTQAFATLATELAQQRAANQARDQVEREEAVLRARAAIVRYGLTPADLGFRGATVVKARVLPRRPGRGEARYQNPDTGRTWTGYGRPPAWIAQSADRESYRIY